MDDLMGAYLRLLVAFPLVIILAYYGLRYLQKYFGPALSMGRRVQVVERTALNARSFLYLVRVGDVYLLLGSTPAGISLLKDLGEHWEAGLPAPNGEDVSGEGALTFSGLLSRLKERRGRKSEGE